MSLRSYVEAQHRPSDDLAHVYLLASLDGWEMLLYCVELEGRGMPSGMRWYSWWCARRAVAAGKRPKLDVEHGRRGGHKLSWRD